MSSSVAILDKERPWQPGFTPSGHRVLVWPIPTSRRSKGGIEIPEILAGREDMAQIQAKVVAIGMTAWGDKPAPWCKEGDTVLIAKYSGYLWDKAPDGRSYRVISDLDIVGVCDAT